MRFLACGLYTTDVFTIFLNTFGNTDYSDPNKMCKWLITRVSNGIEVYDTVSPETKKYLSELMAGKVSFRKGSESRLGGQVGGSFSVLPQILRLDASVSAEVKRVADIIIDKEYYLEDRVAGLNDLIDCITDKAGFARVAMLIDGVDHMNLQNAGQFATNNFPWLSSIRASVVLTALAEFHENGDYASKCNYARLVRVPKIGQIEGLYKMLDKRISSLDASATWSKVCSAEATRLLFDWYSRRRDFSLRTTFRSINYAAYSALQDGSNQILPHHIANGIGDSI